MFTFDNIIEAIQLYKKNAIRTFVTNEGVKQALIDYVDAQTDFTKSYISSLNDVNTKLVAEGIKSVTDVTKFDITKFDVSNLTKSFKVAK